MLGVDRVADVVARVAEHGIDVALYGAHRGGLGRLEAAGLLGEKSVAEAAVEFNAMLEGLANAELRGAVLRSLPEGDEKRAWRNALATVIGGFAGSPGSRRRTT